MILCGPNFAVSYCLKPKIIERLLLFALAKWASLFSLAHKLNFTRHVIITSAPWYFSEMKLEPVAG